MKVENAKLFEEHIEFGLTQWSFLTYSPNMSLTLIGKLKNLEEGEILKEAVDKDLEVFDICSGDFKKSVLMLVKPSTDVKGVKQLWCQQYCKAYGYKLIDMVSIESKPEVPLPDFSPSPVPCTCWKRILPPDNSYTFYIEKSPNLADKSVNQAIRLWLKTQSMKDLEGELKPAEII
jgi:hypothetical protein